MEIRSNPFTSAAGSWRLILSAILMAELAACHFNKSAAVQPDPAHPVLVIGSPAPAFTLPGVDGKTHSLEEYANAKILAVVFQCNHCPASQLYEGRVQRLSEQYRDKGIALVAINPESPSLTPIQELSYTDVPDSLAGMKVRAKYRHFSYPYLYDGDLQEASAKFGVVAMPQIFIFDGDRKLRYQGRIDDSEFENRARTRDAQNAIDALLAAKPVPVAQTPVSGCAMRWLSNGARAGREPAVSTGPVTLEMATPDVLTKLRGNGTGKLLLVNFWATWCGPCVSEFPDLQDTYRMYRGRNFGLVTVSCDTPEAKPAVLDFLRKERASSRNLLFATDDTYGLQDAFDPKMGGAVPFTLLLAPNGDVLYQEEGELNIPQLRRAILAALPDDRQHPGEQAYWSAN